MLKNKDKTISPVYGRSVYQDDRIIDWAKSDICKMYKDEAAAKGTGWEKVIQLHQVEGKEHWKKRAESYFKNNKRNMQKKNVDNFYYFLLKDYIMKEIFKQYKLPTSYLEFLDKYKNGLSQYYIIQWII